MVYHGPSIEDYSLYKDIEKNHYVQSYLSRYI